MRRFLLVLAVLSLCLGAHAELVQIGSGNVINQSLPLEALANYSYSQQLYLATEIGGAGSISSLAFQYNIPNGTYYATNQNLSVWLGLSPQNQLGSWVSQENLTLCYEGDLPLSAFSGGLPGSGWMTVPLTTPHFYDGTANLVIAVRENSAGHSGNNDEFMCTSAAFPRGIVWLNPNPIDASALPSTGFYVRQAFPNLRLEINITHLTPYQPSPVDGATLVPIDTGFSWSSDAPSFDFRFGTAPEALATVQSGLSQTSFFFPEPLGLLSNYYWQVVAWQDGVAYPGPVWSFSTAGELLGPPQNFQAWFQDGSVRLSWQPPDSGTVVDYLVFRNEQQYGVTSQLSFMDENVAQGAVYIYHARARNHLGQISLPSASMSVHIPVVDPTLILFKDFESESLWSQSIPGWTVLDLDGSPTWSWDYADFPGEGQPCGWMVFAPSQTVPALTNFPAHSGSRMMMSPDATIPPDNNWLISQPIYLGSAPCLIFWARSATSDYGLERLRVLISTSGSDPASFISLHTQAWLAVPAAWTQYQYDLNPWQNQTVRLAWQAVSVDAMALFLDDVSVRGEGGYTASDDPLTPAPVLKLWPNPSSGSFKLSLGGSDFDLGIYDIRGRRIYLGKNLNSFDGSHLNLPSGIYILKTSMQGRGHTARLVVIR